MGRRNQRLFRQTSHIRVAEIISTLIISTLLLSGIAGLGGTCGVQQRPYRSLRPSIAFCMVTSSAYSMSLPTGTPVAMRVTLTASDLNNRAR